MHDKEKERKIIRDLSEEYKTKKEIDNKYGLSKNQFTGLVKSLHRRRFNIIEKKEKNQKYFKIADSIVPDITFKNRDLGMTYSYVNRDIRHAYFKKQPQKIRDSLIKEVIDPLSFGSFLCLPTFNTNELLLLDSKLKYGEPHQIKISFSAELDVVKITDKLKEMGFESKPFQQTTRYVGKYSDYSIFVFNNMIAVNGKKSARNIDLKDCREVIKSFYLILTGKNLDCKGTLTYYEFRIGINEFDETDILKVLELLKDEYRGESNLDYREYRHMYHIPFTAGAELIIKYYKEEKNQIIEAISTKGNNSLPLHAERAIHWIVNELDSLYYGKIDKINSPQDIRRNLEKSFKLSNDEITILFLCFNLHIKKESLCFKNIYQNNDFSNKEINELLSSLCDKCLLINHFGTYRIKNRLLNYLIMLHNQLR